MANARVPQLLGEPASRYLDAEFGLGWNAKHPDGRRLEWHEYPLACALRGETVRGQDLMWFREDGSSTWIRVSAAPMKTYAGEVVGAVGVFYDVAEEKQVEEALIRQAEELSRSNADLEEFAYITSHDLQEPVRTIGLYSELLRRRYGGQFDADATQFLRYIRSSADRMGQLVRDMLRYSQVLNVDARVMTEVDMRMVIEWARSNLTAQVYETNAVIEVGELPLVAGDQQQLVQLLQNLIANGMKYSGGRRPYIRVGAEPVKEGWLFRVEDNGIGIATEYKDRIFGIFKRLHGRDVPGTGIGLALCKRIVERHQGRIWVESQPGVGSTFCFLLPLPAQPQERATPAATIELPSDGRV
jgi:light-regulated signal transduction histidine kinase (bacteriophytochrome)